MMSVSNVNVERHNVSVNRDLIYRNKKIFRTNNAISMNCQVKIKRNCQLSQKRRAEFQELFEE